MKNAYFENFDNQYKITKYLIKDIARMNTTECNLVTLCAIITKI